jgi:DNA-binding IclR family transcriptional regulator
VGKIHKQILSLLETLGKPLSLVEVAEQVGKPEKTVYKALRKLFSEGTIECDNKNRTYYLAKEEN